MKLKLKHVKIKTGGMVSFLDEKDAQAMDLKQGERLNISKGNKFVVTIVDITTSNAIDKKGSIGLSEEAFKKLGLKEKSVVELSLVDKPMSLHYIKKKLRGEKLKDQEIYEIVKDIVDGIYSDIEITYFVSACYIHEMDMKETVSLTNAIINTGDILKMKRYPIIDKHCIGGVPGNRTTMIVVPILSALGYTMPKTSARSITSPAGTADTMEVLCPVSFDIDKIKNIVEKTNGCIVWGGAVNMAPADDRIIRVEHPVSLDPTGQLLASIMAKKKSVSATHLLIDIPYGKGAKIEDHRKAESLKKKFELISRKLDMKTMVVLTDGTQPVGNGIGPALEARDVMWVFERDKRAPFDLEKKGLEMAARLIELTKKASYKDALAVCEELLESGEAGEQFKKIIKAQGGKIQNSKQIKLGRFKKEIPAYRGGTVTVFENKKLARIARIAGAPASKGSGIYLHKKVGDSIEKTDTVMTIYSENKDKLKYAFEFYEKMGGIKIN
jgi:putative thymidine phosphorylase